MQHELAALQRRAQLAGETGGAGSSGPAAARRAGSRGHPPWPSTWRCRRAGSAPRRGRRGPGGRRCRSSRPSRASAHPPRTARGARLEHPATASRPRRPSTSGSSTPNSSPPRRATVSAVRSVVLSRSATSWRSTSPWWWPSVSLTSLKWSRSMIITASPPPRRSAARSACWMWSRNSTRLGRPVSASCSD